jgi:tetratricopeptide (TPR) repeat protein
MAGRYGMSFARTHIETGDYEEAVAAATRAIEDGDAGPEPLVDRATALELLERYAEAVRDFEAAIRKNQADQEVDPFMLDDAYFSALVSAARAACDDETLDRYAAVLPDGAHLAESREWQRRVRGELPSLLDKTRDVDAV